MGVTLRAMGADTASKKFAVFFAVSALVLLVVLTRGVPIEPMNSQQLKEDDTEDAIRRSESALEDHVRNLEKTQREMDKAKRELSRLKQQLLDLRNASTNTFPSVVPRNEFDRKRILITGGAGFVGSHLTDALMKQGHEVTVMDNFFTGRKKNVEHWIRHPNFELINHDVVEPFMIEVDEIYHLASPASPPHYMYNPIKTIKTNTLGTINMLGLAKRVGARLLLASTSEVYGNPTVHPQPETYFGNVNPDGPRACYDEGKRIAETMCYAYQKQSGVEVRVARIFNTFGPRMHIGDGRVVSNFIIQALQGQPMTVYGEGKQTRSFQYVSDLVDGLMALMNSDFSDPVNIGNPEEYTMVDFAKSIRELVGDPKVEITHKPATQDDPQRRRPDITRAKQHLGWEPKVKVVDGLKKTIEYFRRELEQPSARAADGRGVGGPYGHQIHLPYVNEE
ncbi:UDP-glucuronate decarboxylase 1 [Salpingoeca rosetta]|uniref:UDP-glucuronic acid decarboxylase 1 n=1 Tax=Salpingoeca rosetta (strain ATCC 50818 / BSB-021) TaxID=946362 RepID=F2UH37_SALR5|nr:UDP-glucuronate decarboxylase 1 [Salpingoeca rosetta]EGD76436.1 UDP-glucuronate decarboxylase 1 [Salpingoeca rosetta]|eukprot:XP_004991351.1 UDP-glucuronate decarboxylase 1 [Salpingoeca rosetta]